MTHQPKMKRFYYDYIYLVRRHLGKRRGIASALPVLIQTPELVDIQVGELKAALNLFERYQTVEDLRNPDLFCNSEHLARALVGKTLPEWETLGGVITTTASGAHALELARIFAEIGEFQFPDMRLKATQTLGTLFIALYRTYVLTSYPELRQKQAKIGSAVEEMLALLALRGYKTSLYAATKLWIEDHENEGFAEKLAMSLKDL